MDVMEKLVEILADAGMGKTERNFLADRLIANGVTVQESGHWVTLTDCSNEGVYCSVCHKKVYMNDYALCNRKNKLRSNYCPNCGSKMVPKPPKGE